MTGAGNGSRVVSLVYLAAHALAEGESAAELSASYPTTPGVNHVVPSPRQGFLWLDPPYFPPPFVADIALARARVLAVSQKPINPSCFTDTEGPAAWDHLPSWYAVSPHDQTIDPHQERWYAKRLHATTRDIPSSHASPVSHPGDVAHVILEAAQVGKRGYKAGKWTCVVLVQREDQDHCKKLPEIKPISPTFSKDIPRSCCQFPSLLVQVCNLVAHPVGDGASLMR